MKLLKKLMSKRNNAGFTLVEVVISVALLGVLLVSMTLFVGPVLQAAGGAKKDIRASVLAETISAYVDRSVKYSRHVAVFDGAAITGAQKTTDMNAIYDSDELKKFKEFFEADPDAHFENIYEIRCIGICWRMDDRTNESKYMLSLGKVGKAGTGRYEILKTTQVFEDCFYDELFPVIKVEAVSSPTDGSKTPAFKMNIDVYSNDAMTDVAMSGAGYTQLINITKDNAEKNLSFKTVRTPASGEKTDTYIFYITRKTF